MVPVGRGVQQEYQDMQRSFTCCVGTGMESHALHGDGVYYESNDTIWVNLFVPSTAEFTSGGVKLAHGHESSPKANRRRSRLMVHAEQSSRSPFVGRVGPATTSASR